MHQIKENHVKLRKLHQIKEHQITVLFPGPCTCAILQYLSPKLQTAITHSILNRFLSFWSVRSHLYRLSVCKFIESETPSLKMQFLTSADSIVELYLL